MEKREITIVALVVILAFFINGLYGNFQFPLHADEYAHIAQAQDILIKGKIDFVNPYYKFPIQELRLESGFHIFIAIFIFLLKDNFLIFFNVIKNLIFALNTFLIFLLAYKLSKKFPIGIFASLFFITLKSSYNLLGNIFLLPLNLGITGILIFLILFKKYLENPDKKTIYSSLATIFITGIIYPPAFIFLLLLISIFSILNFQKKEIKKFYIPFITISIVLGFSLIFIFLKKQITNNGLNYFIQNFIIFSSKWTPIKANASPIFYFGLISFLLAFLGLLIILNKKIKSNSLLPIWFGITLFNNYTYYLFEKTFFIPFERNFIFYLISLCILAAHGLFFLLTFISQKIKSKKIFALTLIVALVFSIQFVTFYNYTQSEEIKNLLTENDLKALQFIDDKYKSQVILAEDKLSFFIFPFTQNYVISLAESNINIGKKEKQLEFLEGNCETKKQIAQELSIEAVLVRKEINCDFAKLVYDNDLKIYDLS